MRGPQAVGRAQAKALKQELNKGQVGWNTEHEVPSGLEVWVGLVTGLL